MGILIFLLIGYLLLSIGLFFVFPKANEEGWKGLVPGYNFGILAKIVGRNPWHAAWLLFPIVNIFIYSGLLIDLVRSFGKHKFWHSVLAVVGGPLFTIYLGLDDKEKYEGPILTMEKEYHDKIQQAKEGTSKRQFEKLVNNNPYKKSGIREWAESIIFAVFAAAFIRMFLLEAYVIPTPSMEGSLLVGDFLFVSKVHYGVRTPMTIAMIPLLHNRIPFFNTESYLKKPSLPYYRLPALQKVQRNKPFVFNWPVGDSVYLTKDRSWAAFQVKNNNVPVGGASLITRPLDKKDHYIKRCVALPGDSLQIINRQLYINGEKAVNPEHMQFLYQVQSSSTRLNMKMFEKIGVSVGQSYPNQGAFFLTEKQVERIKTMGDDITVTLRPGNSKSGFPIDPNNTWTVDNFGPLYIPAEGQTVEINTENISLYHRIISVYEGNEIIEKDGKFTINGQEASTYTFKQNYYWAMGDNRHNSEDSRAWGFVPEDHLVGKPMFIWFSVNNGSLSNGIRWNRLFTSANKD